MNDSLTLRRAGGIADTFRPRGKFHVQHLRDGKASSDNYLPKLMLP